MLQMRILLIHEKDTKIHQLSDFHFICFAIFFLGYPICWFHVDTKNAGIIKARNRIKPN